MQLKPRQPFERQCRQRQIAVILLFPVQTCPVWLKACQQTQLPHWWQHALLLSTQHSRQGMENLQLANKAKTSVQHKSWIVAIRILQDQCVTGAYKSTSGFRALMAHFAASSCQRLCLYRRCSVWGYSRYCASSIDCSTSRTYADTVAIRLAANRRLFKHHCFLCFTASMQAGI